MNSPGQSVEIKASGAQTGENHAASMRAQHAYAPAAPPGQMFGYVGGALLALGVFGPAAELGNLGISVIAKGNTKGVVILALAFCGAVLAHLRQFVFIWIPAVIVALMLGDMCLTLLDTPSASLFGSTIRLAPGWGLFVMLAGNVLLLCSAWIGSFGKKT
jgi:hypothetical protein